MVQLVAAVHKEFGGNSCAVSVTTHHDSHSTWFVHAKASGFCSSGATFESAMETFRKEYGHKKNTELAAELRAKAEALAKQASELEASP